MKHIKTISLIFFLLSSVAAYAAGEDWSFDPYSFRYDMTMYVAIDAENVLVKDYSRYRVGAFCGTECRGILEPKTYGDYTYGYLRIRSNTTEGETICFKVLDTSTGKVYDIPQKKTFKSNEKIAYPSSPFVFYIYNDSFLFGDVNHDGKISIEDIALLVNYNLYDQSKIIWRISDSNNNRKVDEEDLEAIANCILKKNQ